ncbi:MAG TPA: tRNA uridine-5-carboxymethylaminomethyl(34) synthesis GTPase MnmE [Chthoniobacterales bacterium]
MHRRLEERSREESAGLKRGLSPGDTIAAISTPPGEGAIALVRLSGEGALAVADNLFRGSARPSEFRARLQHFGTIMDGNTVVDEVLVSVHRAPASYTGEDLVEISCHGGTLVSAKILELCLRAGARAARPGEFTERAFLNGKMDLTQAEAVIDLIRAKTDLALRSATEQLEGSLGRRIAALRDELIALSAHVEASLDFADEDIAPDEGEKLRDRLSAIEKNITELLATAEGGRILREGVRVVLYGPTNAGKSSLLNRLLGFDRAIVSESHGTTRDTVEEAMNLRGISVRLFDTAGLREAIDAVERAGIARTERSLQQADLSLFIADLNAPRPADFKPNRSDRAEFIVLNKSDLPEHPDWKDTVAVRISCLNGAGFPQLEEEMFARLAGGNLQAESAVAINARHRDCLRRALEACHRASVALTNGLTADCYALDIKQALTAVGEVIGAVDYEQILDSVFGQFCIGK